MPSRMNAILRVEAEAEIRISEITKCLDAVEHAYNSILVLENAVNKLEHLRRQFDFPLRHFPWDIWPLGWKLFPMGVWPPTREAITSLVPYRNRLLLHAVRLESPGFWDFLGKLNPLEVIRLYLKDRHERRKDREYREPAEKRRLELENAQLENTAALGGIRVLRELGATDEDLAPLKNELLGRPLRALDSFQDRGVIVTAEILKLESNGKNDEEG